jgi:hypothetical protein
MLQSSFVAIFGSIGSPAAGAIATRIDSEALIRAVTPACQNIDFHQLISGR